jgi:hypothetical protein
MKLHLSPVHLKYLKIFTETVFWDITLCRPLKSQPAFQRNILPPSLRFKSRPRKKLVKISAWFLLYTGFMLDIMFNPQDRSDVLLINVG